jgi:hypothetical protein
MNVIFAGKRIFKILIHGNSFLVGFGVIRDTIISSQSWMTIIIKNKN